MVKVAIIKIGNKYISREYIKPEDLLTRDKSMEYGEYEWLEDAVENLNKTFKEEEFSLLLKI